MERTIQRKRERKKQSNRYSKDSIPDLGAEWFEVLFDFVEGLKSGGAADDEK